jgi:hypothetical protein
MSRELINDDAVAWIRRQKMIPNIITGFCDLDETSLDFEEYLKMVKQMARLALARLHPQGYAIFIQTDRKYQGQWVSKPFILMQAAKEAGVKLLWHKIILHREVGKVDTYRPGYAHMLCFSRDGGPGAATPDVMPPGTKSYKNATPEEPALMAAAFIKRYSKAPLVIVDPFVGRGTVMAIANALGMDGVGIDIDPTQLELARVARYRR